MTVQCLVNEKICKASRSFYDSKRLVPSTYISLLYRVLHENYLKSRKYVITSDICTCIVSISIPFLDRACNCRGSTAIAYFRRGSVLFLPLFPFLLSFSANENRHFCTFYLATDAYDRLHCYFFFLYSRRESCSRRDELSERFIVRCYMHHSFSLEQRFTRTDRYRGI